MKLCHRGASGLSLGLWIIALLSLNNSSNAQVNSWISPTSGNWQDSSWSLGVLPGPNQTILITNAGWKAVAIGANTAANFLQSLTVDSITIASPTNTVNSLLMDFVGVGTPLIVNSVTNENSVITLQSSSLHANYMSIGGTFNQNNFSGVSAGTMQIGDVGPAVYTMNNGTLAVTNLEVIGGWGHTAVFDQEGGYHYATPLWVNAGGGEYDLHGGQLGGDVQMTGGILNQYGGDLALTNFSVDGFYAQFGGTIEAPNGFSITGGTATQSGGTNTSGSLFAGSPMPGYDNGSGAYIMSNGVLNVTSATINYRGTLDQEGGIINISGPFSLPSNLIPPAPGFLVSGQFLKGGGMFSAGSFNFSGYIVQDGGTNEVRGDLTADWLQGTYVLNGGLLSTSNTVTQYGAITQNGGSHIVKNSLRVTTANFPYTMRGGQLTAPNIEINGSGFNHEGGTVNSTLITLNNGSWNEETASVQLSRLQLNGPSSLGLLTNPNSLTLTNGPCVVRFADSSEQVWSNNATLIIGNWAGSITGGGQSQVIFGNNSGGLSGSQLAAIQFQFSGSNYPAKMLASGEVVPELSGPPFAPTGLAATALSSNRIDLHWTDNAVNESGYGIERSLDGTNFVQISVTAENATSYSDTNVSAGVQYYYRVVALGTDGNSDYSDATIGTSKLASPIPGMIAWWRGEGTAEDAIGTHDGSFLWPTGFSTGKVGSAFDFNGSYLGVSVPDSPDFVLTNAFTIEGWIYPYQLTSGFVCTRGDARSGLDTWTVHMEHIPGYLSFQIDDASNNYVEIDAPVQTNQWQHFAATFDTTNGLRLYINGVLAAETNTMLVPIGVLDQTQEASVGIGNAGTFFDNFPFEGKVDELAIYSRALTPVEIQNIYNTGSLGKLALLSAPASMSLNREPGGVMQLNLIGAAGRTYEVDISTDLIHWTPWQTQLNTTGTISLTDDTTTNHPTRFYRTVPLP